MTLKEFKEKIKSSKIKPDTEIVIHIENGEFPISLLEYNKQEKKLHICTDEWCNKSQYKVKYSIIKDHSELVESSEYNIFAVNIEELLLDFDGLKDKIFSKHGISGNVNEKSGSIAMEIPDWDYVIEKDVIVKKPTKKTHYFTCQLLEIFKVVDEENDIYMRVWHDGRIR